MKMIKKSIFFLPLLLTGGCIWFQTDPAAEEAAAIYCRDKKVPTLMTLHLALKTVPPSGHPALRVEFARLAAARSGDRNAPEKLLQQEESRLKLNAMLGYWPQDIIGYVTTGVLDETLPELPPAEDMEKAALICRRDLPATELLRDLRLAYNRAVCAANRAAVSPGPEEKKECLIAYVLLAETAGIPYGELISLSGYVKRFDRAAKRLKMVKSGQTGEF